MGCGASVPRPTNVYTQVENPHFRYPVDGNWTYKHIKDYAKHKRFSIGDVPVNVGTMFINETIFPVRINVLFLTFTEKNIEGHEIEKTLIPFIPFFVNINLRNIASISYTQGWWRVFEPTYMYLKIFHNIYPSSSIVNIYNGKGKQDSTIYIVRSCGSKNYIFTSYNHKGEEIISDEK